MRITRNRTPNVRCNLCGEPLVLGQLGANYLPDSVHARRGHVACVNRWRKRILAGLREEAR
jgi:hypothetical protein